MTADRRTEVLLLPVAHLTSQVADTALAPGLARLRAWRPDLVAIENLPGYRVVEYEQRGGPFTDFDVAGAPVARAAALAAGRLRTWDHWQARRIASDPTQPVIERVLGWLVAREPLNALLLPWRECGLTDEVAAVLTEIDGSPSESVRVGVRVAEPRGHRYLAHIDDHTSVSMTEHFPPDWTVIEQEYAEHARGVPPPPALGVDRLASPWRFWRAAATPEARAYYELLESGLRVTYDDPTGVVRARLAQWCARNLAMAANIREASGAIPGGRLLVIIGTSHEGPIRSALAAGEHDLRLIDLATLEGLSEVSG